MLERRSFLTGLISLVAAPAIVRAGSLMPVRVMVPYWYDYAEVYDRYGPLSDLKVAQEMINLRRSLTLKYLLDNSFKPYDSLVDGLLSNARFVEAIEANA